MKQLGLSSVGENLAKGLFDLLEKFLKFRINGWPVYKASSLLVHCPLISGEGGGVVEPQPPSTRRPTRNQNSFLNQTQTKSSKLKSIQVHQPTTQHQTKIYFSSRLLNIILHCTMQEVWPKEICQQPSKFGKQFKFCPVQSFQLDKI